MARKLKTINKTGLVGEWLLNGNALDTSGSGNNGVGTNVTYTSTDRGYQSQCGSFNGSSSLVDCGTTLSSCFGGLFSISIWAKSNSSTGTANYNCLIENCVSGGAYPEVTIRQSNVSNTYFVNFYTGSTSQSTTFTVPDITKWNHIILTRDTNTTYKVYINNNQTPAANVNIVNQSYTRTNFTIGKYSTTSWWNGNIQGVRAYNYVLSQQEIQTLYQEGLRQLGGEGYGTLFDGLVAMYDFNGDGQDIVGGNNGTVTGATLTTDRFGTSNRAYNFTADGNNITILSSSSISIAYPLTVGSWINTTDTPAFEKVPLRKSGSNGLWGFNYGYPSAGKIAFQVYNGATNYRPSSTNSIGDGNWHFIVGTISSSQMIKLYVDGEFNSQVQGSGLVAPDGNLTFSLGGNFYVGKLDETKIYNKELSADEIKLLYQLSSTRCLLPN